MADPLLQVLAKARSRWMIGGAPAGEEHPIAAGLGPLDGELALLAVAGQFQRLRQPPKPPPLTVRPDLPVLLLPPVPDALRPLARKLLTGKPPPSAVLLASFVARRGYVLHPVDWMPPPDADLPEVYHPLQNWQRRQPGEAVHLSGETWLDHGRAQRLALFRQLRAKAPDGARLLLSAHIAASPAEERLSLVEALGARLSNEDAPFLESLSADRSEKVRAAAVQLLARLGRGGAPDELAQDAAQMFEQASEGLLRRRPILRLKKDAKDGQIRTLVQSLQNLTLPALAQALGLTPSDVVARWRPENAGPAVQQAVTGMIMRSAADDDLAAHWRQMQDQPDIALRSLAILFARLPAPEQEAAMLWRIRQSGVMACEDVLTLMGVAPPPAVSAALTARRSELIEMIRISRDAAPEKAAGARSMAQSLAALLSTLGVLVTAEDASAFLASLTVAGLHPADPALDWLHFNAALKGP